VDQLNEHFKPQITKFNEHALPPLNKFNQQMQPRVEKFSQTARPLLGKIQAQSHNVIVLGLTMWLLWTFNDIHVSYDSKPFPDPIRVRHHLNTILYGPEYFDGRTSHATKDLPMKLRPNQRQNMVESWKEATVDPAVLPYRVCYGPSHYPTKHVCNKYCITPAEVKAVRKQDRSEQLNLDY